MASAKLRRPVLENLIEDVAESLGSWAYLLVAVMAMAETAAFLGFIAPGEFTIILGRRAGGRGHALGRAPDRDRVGLDRHRRLDRLHARAPAGPRIRASSTAPGAPHRGAAQPKVEDYFRRHGGKTIFFGRWIGFVRPLMPFTAGTSGMPYRRFLPYDVLGAGLFGHHLHACSATSSGGASTRSRASQAKGALGLGDHRGGRRWWACSPFKRLRHAEDRQRAAAWFRRQGERPALRPLVRPRPSSADRSGATSWVRSGATSCGPIWRHVAASDRPLAGATTPLPLSAPDPRGPRDRADDSASRSPPFAATSSASRPPSRTTGPDAGDSSALDARARHQRPRG